MTHLIESHVTCNGRRWVVSFCRVEGDESFPRMTRHVGAVTCLECLDKLAEVSRAEWAAVKP